MQFRIFDFIFKKEFYVPFFIFVFLISSFHFFYLPQYGLSFVTWERGDAGIYTLRFSELGDGNILTSEDYTAEQRDANFFYNPMYSLSDFIGYILFLIGGGPTKFYICLFFLVFSSILFFSFFFFLYSFCKNISYSVIGTYMAFVGVYLPQIILSFLITTFPQLAQVFSFVDDLFGIPRIVIAVRLGQPLLSAWILFFALGFFILYERNPKDKLFTFLFVLVGGSVIYFYPYLVSFFFLFLLIYYFMIFLFSKTKIQEVKKRMVPLLLLGVIALFGIANYLLFLSNPISKDVLSFWRLVMTNTPIFPPQSIFFISLLFIISIFLFKRRFIGFFFLALAFSMFIVLNIHVITSFYLQPHHFIQYVIKPISIGILSVFFLNKIRLSKRYVFFLTSFLILLMFFLQFFSFLNGSFENKLLEPSFIETLNWLDKNTDKNSVVLSDMKYVSSILHLTHNKVYIFQQEKGYIFLSKKELIDRYCFASNVFNETYYFKSVESNSIYYPKLPIVRYIFQNNIYNELNCSTYSLYSIDYILTNSSTIPKYGKRIWHNKDFDIYKFEN
ncbi:hypothetical protein KAW38_00015 [Candidatus Micrarchaeota archaeon]|nr:hypothetical protein [Candidatus Micrarchaeota archaeon]